MAQLMLLTMLPVKKGFSKILNLKGKSKVIVFEAYRGQITLITMCYAFFKNTIISILLRKYRGRMTCSYFI